MLISNCPIIFDFYTENLTNWTLLSNLFRFFRLFFIHLSFPHLSIEIYC